MKTSKFTEEQIGFALRQADLGTPVAEVCRKMAISEATYFRWKRKYGGLGPSELRKLRQLEEENQKLKRLVADLSLDKAMLQDVLSKKVQACSAARGRSVAERSLQGERAPRLCGAALRPFGASLPVWPRRAGFTPQADERDYFGACALRLPAHPRAVAAGGLACEPQARATALSRRGFEPSGQATRRHVMAARRLDRDGRRLPIRSGRWISSLMPCSMVGASGL